MKMLLNAIGLSGFAAVNYGVYLHWGESITFMFGGATALLFALRALHVYKGN